MEYNLTIIYSSGGKQNFYRISGIKAVIDLFQKEIYYNDAKIGVCYHLYYDGSTEFERKFYASDYEEFQNKLSF